MNGEHHRITVNHGEFFRSRGGESLSDDFQIFGAAIGSRVGDIDGISYGAFIIPGLVMLSLLNESISNASFGIYMPKWSGTVYELLSAPVSWFEVVLGYVGALDDSEFAQLVADARGTNAKDAAAAALEQFIRHR